MGFQREAEYMKPSRLLSLIAGAIMLVLPASMKGQTFTGSELLARPTDHSITLNVVSSSALDAYIEYGTSSGSYPYTTSTVTKAANEPIVIVVDGLSADTKYYYRLRYRVSGGGAFSARSEHTFHTQRPAGSTFSFDVTSDSHVNVAGLGVPATWQQTLTNIANDNPDYLIDLGDTFAMDNVTSESAARTNYIFQRTDSYFGRVSHSASIFIATGNHEQEEGWHIVDPVGSPAVWGTNARKRYFPNPVPNDFYTGNTDTYSSIDGDQLHEDYYAWTWGDALFVVIDPFWYTTIKPFTGNIGGGEDSDPGDGDRWHWTLGLTQYNWLKQTLENSNATYKFIFAHHMTGGSQDYVRKGAYGAPYCEWGGYDENGTTWGFDTKRSGWYKPVHQLMVENGATAFFHGHDHEYAYEKLDGIVYQELPSGGFSGYGFGLYSEGGYTIKVLPSPGHLRVTVSPSQTTVEYVGTTSGSVNYTYTIPAPSVAVNAKIFLQGPYSGSSMSTALNASGYLPLSQPYNGSPWNYSGLESVASGFFASHTDIVDWVLVELRKTYDGASVGRRAAFIKNNGTIVDLGGSSAVGFTGKAAGDYYIVIRHRNHLAVMSASAIPLSSSSSLYDFTTAQMQAYGTSPMVHLAVGVFGMCAGDATGDGQVNASDRSSVDNNLNLTGFLSADVTLDGQANASDRSRVDNSLNRVSQVP
jgi:hypothetical protein